GIEHLIERQDPEVPRHELDDGTQADHRSADADARESELGDRRVDDTHLTELLEQAFRDLVRALVHRDFLAHEEDAIVALHLFAQRLVQRVAVRDYGHVNPRRRLRPWRRTSYPRGRPPTTLRPAARDSCRRNQSRPAPRP